jgi:hypothetical protein
MLRAISLVSFATVPSSSTTLDTATQRLSARERYRPCASTVSCSSVTSIVADRLCGSMPIPTRRMGYILRTHPQWTLARRATLR